ncbi:MAG TPA: alpha/beta hydrolase [Candidatus Eisenbacteria bacterium]|nr:alpha/beta hydrolase [Candidatus Eisenbacteria bacterium]
MGTALAMVAIAAVADTAPLPFVEPAHAVRVTRDVIYREAPVRSPEPGTRALLLDLYQPDSGSARRPAFVAVHGGGLERGTRGSENMAQLCEELAKRGYVCASIDYRLHGDDPPGPAATSFLRTLDAATEDTGEAVRWLVRNAARYRIDPARIAVGGVSAGAAVALHLIAHPRHGVPVRAVFSWSGPGEWADDVLEPGMPPLFIAHGVDDASVSVDEARAIARRARSEGIARELCICEGLGHVLPLDRRPGGVSLYDRLAAFLWREMDLAAITPRGEASRVRAAVAAIPHPADDEAAMPCPK